GRSEHMELIDIDVNRSSLLLGNPFATHQFKLELGQEHLAEKAGRVRVQPTDVEEKNAVVRESLADREARDRVAERRPQLGKPQELIQPIRKGQGGPGRVLRKRLRPEIFEVRVVDVGDDRRAEGLVLQQPNDAPQRRPGPPYKHTERAAQYRVGARADRSLP